MRTVEQQDVAESYDLLATTVTSPERERCRVSKIHQLGCECMQMERSASWDVYAYISITNGWFSSEL